MKTTRLLALLAGASSSAIAQNIVVTGGGGAPLNQAIVIQPAPVIVQAPGGYGVPGVYCAPVTPCYYSSPNVIYFGGPEARWRNYATGSGYCNTPTVTYFGRGPSCSQGYHFRRFR